ncbi:ATP-binding cassette sub-family G member 1-like [Schistocerca serialis cubense]|uniref:ATP-binding cassette sub-family G member 1-like n=1 Tax=Schistocerca serialis cubense TaxID=2023355 RepID=UPI00214F0909|nr:ATP-binding cassette sub-family G member 1-like [Schistocerca serialis cubense]XP_049939493.1 ATP-binding cassette sub-family G member 1-like [Schistocerca serialis cubense]XP_049939494.1 ATP-binding cassette sub-family G member 1-like [Schistocerca serialis cubense]
MTVASPSAGDGASSSTSTASVSASCCLLPRGAPAPGAASLSSSTTSSVSVAEPLQNNNYYLHRLAEADCGDSTPRFATAGPPVSVQFTDVRYSTYVWSVQQPIPRRKEILHGVSGEFCAGQLTAIMGPSGAGKSTLLNVLALYKTRGAEGDVRANGVRCGPAFRRQSVYIQQDDRLRPAVTPLEALVLAARLKLGCGHQEALQQARSLLEMLGLLEQRNTLTRRLSGGQRKRLAVALELVGNPSVIFLDEPTTGLDSSSCSQCLSLLKLLAQEGRTVVCTIHQPSALLFQMFDHVYTLSAGRCVYQGTPSQLLPFLDTLGLHCPPYHNPADFMIDVCVGECGVDIEELAAASAEKMKTDTSVHYISKGDVDLHKLEYHFSDDKNKNKQSHKEEKSTQGANIFLQYYLLYRRSLTCLRRDCSHLINRLLAHLTIGLVFGYLYYNCGNSADAVFADFVYLYGTVLFLMYTGKMAVTLHFPLELKIIKSEHFNQWYSLPSYYLSLLSVEIPIQIACNSIYLGISYYATSQPPELYRIAMFFILTNVASLAAQGSGFVIGALTPTKVAVFLGPVLLVLISMFGFNIFHKDIPSSLEFMFYISYFRAAFQGIITVTLADGRDELPCPEDVLYCHYRYTKKFLTEVDILNVDVMGNLYMILGVAVMMYVGAFLSVWYKVARR